MSLRQEVSDLMVALMSQQKVIPLSYLLKDLAEEVSKVPEKPEGYEPRFQVKRPGVVILVTGGLDSTLIYLTAKQRYPEADKIIPLYVDVGQPYVEKEREALKELGITGYRFERQIQLMGDYWRDKYWKHIIPGRNLLLLVIAAEVLSSFGGMISFGAVDGEMPVTGGDKSIKFVALMKDLLHRYRVTLDLPLGGKTKTDIVKEMIAHFPGKAEQTISCFSQVPGHCGECQACLRKWVAFTNNGLELKTRTPIHLGCGEYITKYRTLMTKAMEENDFTRYSKRRCEQTLNALMQLETA